MRKAALQQSQAEAQSACPLAQIKRLKDAFRAKNG